MGLAGPARHPPPRTAAGRAASEQLTAYPPGRRVDRPMLQAPSAPNGPRGPRPRMAVTLVGFCFVLHPRHRQMDAARNQQRSSSGQAPQDSRTAQGATSTGMIGRQWHAHTAWVIREAVTAQAAADGAGPLTSLASVARQPGAARRFAATTAHQGAAKAGRTAAEVVQWVEEATANSSSPNLPALGRIWDKLRHSALRHGPPSRTLSGGIGRAGHAAPLGATSRQQAAGPSTKPRRPRLPKLYRAGARARAAWLHRPVGSVPTPPQAISRTDVEGFVFTAQTDGQVREATLPPAPVPSGVSPQDWVIRGLPEDTDSQSRTFRAWAAVLPNRGSPAQTRLPEHAVLAIGAIQAELRRGHRRTPTSATLHRAIYSNYWPRGTCSASSDLWIVQQARRVWASERALAMGVPRNHRLTQVLHALQRSGGASTALLRACVGEGLDANVAATFFRLAIQLAGLGSHITYGSLCSGVDVAACGWSKLPGVTVAYEYMAELCDSTSAIHRQVWGDAVRRHRRADSEAVRAEVAVDVCLITTRCQPFCGLNQRSTRDAPVALQEFSRIMACAAGSRPTTILVENTSNLAGRGFSLELLEYRAILMEHGREYAWCSTVASPESTAGWPTLGARLIHVGVRRDRQSSAAVTSAAAR